MSPVPGSLTNKYYLPSWKHDDGTRLYMNMATETEIDAASTLSSWSEVSDWVSNMGGHFFVAGDPLHTDPAWEERWRARARWWLGYYDKIGIAVAAQLKGLILRSRWSVGRRMWRQWFSATAAYLQA